MNIDFPLLMVILTFGSGAIALVDVLWFARKRKKTGENIPWYFDYARSFFPVFLLVLIIRSFIAQPFRVPTGSLEPTIIPVDLVAVNQFAYGLRLPVLNKKILAIGEPKIGDIVVFRYPPNPKIDYVKRVIGTPGDHIVYRNKQLTINGTLVIQKFLRSGYDVEPDRDQVFSEIREEHLNGKIHEILIHQNDPTREQTIDVVVPPNSYFVMGDNRDDSIDSRYWGFVPEENLIGKAFLIWMSWDSVRHRIRFHRIGLTL